MTKNGDISVIQVFPHSARLAGGHTNAITAFMESQLHHGLQVQGLSPLGHGIPAALNTSIEHLPIREMDFDGPDFCGKAMALATGSQRRIFFFIGITRPFWKLARRLKEAGVPYIVGSQGQLHFYGAMNWLKKFIYLNFVNYFVRNASGIHFTTHFEARRVHYLLPLWRKPVLVQNNLFRAPDPGVVAPMSRGELDLPTKSFVFAFMGRLDVAQKGLDYLMKAFARVSAEKDCYLALIGPDWANGRHFLERLAKQLKCLNRVRFLGPQYGENKWRALKIADAFVAPSRWEGFGVAQAEAIGFGLPALVSTRMNLAPELLEHHAALAEPLSAPRLAEAMCRLIEDSRLRQSLSDCGRKWAAENCAIETAGVRFEEFYLKLLAPKKLSRDACPPH